jgi:uridine phosphorylase
MGSANMDFVVREIRAVVSGDMIVFRVGSCGALKAHVGVNSFIFSDAAAFVETNYDAFHDFRDCSDSWYKISKYVRADESLTEHVCNRKNFELLTFILDFENCSRIGRY